MVATFKVQFTRTKFRVTLIRFLGFCFGNEMSGALWFFKQTCRSSVVVLIAPYFHLHNVDLILPSKLCSRVASIRVRQILVQIVFHGSVDWSLLLHLTWMSETSYYKCFIKSVHPLQLASWLQVTQPLWLLAGCKSWWKGGCGYLSNGERCTGWSRCHGDEERRQLRVDCVGIRIIHRRSKPPLPNQPYQSSVRGLPHGYEGPSWIKPQLQVLIFWLHN